jgi:hypothetical protein
MTNEREKVTENKYDQGFDDGRRAFADDVVETLRVRGYWTPPSNTTPDIIMALAIGLDSSNKDRTWLLMRDEVMEMLEHYRGLIVDDRDETTFNRVGEILSKLGGAK